VHTEIIIHEINKFNNKIRFDLDPLVPNIDIDINFKINGYKKFRISCYAITFNRKKLTERCCLWFILSMWIVDPEKLTYLKRAEKVRNIREKR